MSQVPKRQQIKSKALRMAAKGESCVICGIYDGTTVMAHLKHKDAGTGQKCDDILSAHLCYPCHVMQEQTRDIELSYLALRRTITRLIDNGVISINE